MLVNDANGKHLVAPGVLYVIQKYVYKKKSAIFRTKMLDSRALRVLDSGFVLNSVWFPPEKINSWIRQWGCRRENQQKWKVHNASTSKCMGARVLSCTKYSFTA